MAKAVLGRHLVHYYAEVLQLDGRSLVPPTLIPKTLHYSLMLRAIDGADKGPVLAFSISK